MESAATATAEPEPPARPVLVPVLVYDDACRLCSAVAASVRRRDRDKRLELCGASNAAGILARHGVAAESARSEVYLLEPAGPVLRGVAVIPAVLAHLPRWRRIAPLFRLRPFSYLLAGIWLLVKQLRHEL